MDDLSEIRKTQIFQQSPGDLNKWPEMAAAWFTVKTEPGTEAKLYTPSTQWAGRILYLWVNPIWEKSLILQNMSQRRARRWTTVLREQSKICLTWPRQRAGQNGQIQENFPIWALDNENYYMVKVRPQINANSFLVLDTRPYSIEEDPDRLEVALERVRVSRQ